MPLPLIDVGEGFSATVHCQQRERKEPHFSRGLEEARPTDYNTSAIIHHRVDSPRMISLLQQIVSLSL